MLLLVKCPVCDGYFYAATDDLIRADRDSCAYVVEQQGRLGIECPENEESITKEHTRIRLSRLNLPE